MRSNNDAQIFCKNVRYLRIKNGLTQKRMAQIMGIGVSCLRLLESGSIPPRMSCEILYQLYDTFLISTDLLLSYDLESGC